MSSLSSLPIDVTRISVNDGPTTRISVNDGPAIVLTETLHSRVIQQQQIKRHFINWCKHHFILESNRITIIDKDEKEFTAR